VRGLPCGAASCTPRNCEHSDFSALVGRVVKSQALALRIYGDEWVVVVADWRSANGNRAKHNQQKKTLKEYLTKSHFDTLYSNSRLVIMNNVWDLYFECRNKISSKLDISTQRRCSPATIQNRPERQLIPWYHCHPKLQFLTSAVPNTKRPIPRLKLSLYPSPLPPLLPPQHPYPPS
jgi:hypothetical protein